MGVCSPCQFLYEAYGPNNSFGPIVLARISSEIGFALILIPFIRGANKVKILTLFVARHFRYLKTHFKINICGSVGNMFGFIRAGKFRSAKRLSFSKTVE